MISTFVYFQKCENFNIISSLIFKILKPPPIDRIFIEWPTNISLRFNYAVIQLKLV